MNPCISVVINTLNEERNLPFALRSVVPWADEIVVVDMHSTDGTVEIARQHGARVCFHEGPGVNYPPREFAVAQAKCEWVFVLDADEVVPLALSQDLRRIAGSGDADVAAIPRRNFVMGAAMKGAGWGPAQDCQLRFFKKCKIVARSIAHQDFTPAVGARVARLAYNGRNAIVHFSYLDSAQFLAKLNQYTTIEATQRLERLQHASCVKALAYASREFLVKYLKSGGYRDGWRGLYVASFMAFYRLATFVKIHELESVGKAELVERFYRDEAEKVITEYERPVAEPSLMGQGEF